MRTLTHYLLAAVLFVGPASLAQAGGGCFVYHGGGYVQHQQAYRAPVHHDYHEKKVVVLEYLPLYAVGYSPPAKPDPAADARASALEAKIAALEAKLAAAGPSGSGVLPAPRAAKEPEQPAAPAKAQAAAQPGKSILAGRCASCHDSAVAASKGGKLSLTDAGSPLALDDAKYGAVLRAVTKGTMPRGSKLSEEEYNGLVNEMIGLMAK